MLRIKRLAQKQKSRSRYKYFFAGLIVIFFALVGLFIYKFYSIDKFIVLNRLPNGGGEILIIDSKNDLSKKYYIGPDTVLESSRGYGQYKLQNLWTLAEKENINGELVVESISKNYSLPIFLWNDGKYNNLDIFQKIKLGMVSKSNNTYHSEFKKYELDKLVLVNFLNLAIQDENIDLGIEDLTGDQATADKVSLIINNLGAKVSGYSKGYDQNLDCEIVGKNSEITGIISKIFGCNIVSVSLTKETVKIRLGAAFAERF